MMNAKQVALSIALILAAAAAPAQQSASAPRAGGEAGARHEPPPQAYTDCRGKKAGDVVQHTTPEGVVEALCTDSPKGLVARPRQAQRSGG